MSIRQREFDIVKYHWQSLKLKIKENTDKRLYLFSAIYQTAKKSLQKSSNRTIQFRLNHNLY